MSDTEALMLEARLASLEQRVHELERGKSRGRQAKPILVSAEGICGLEPAIDSATCPYASIYRKQKGCKGAACVLAASTYYENYRRERRVTS